MKRNGPVSTKDTTVEVPTHSSNNGSWSAEFKTHPKWNLMMRSMSYLGTSQFRGRHTRYPTSYPLPIPGVRMVPSRSDCLLGVVRTRWQGTSTGSETSTPRDSRANPIRLIQISSNLLAQPRNSASVNDMGDSDSMLKVRLRTWV